MQVRLAQARDLDAVLALYAQLHPGEEPAPPERSRMVFEHILSAPHLSLIVAQAQDAAVAGTCYLNVIENLSRAAFPYGVLENVVVDQRVRGQGIGKALVAFALARAWQAGCYKVMLQTGSQRESTHGFYRACGFSAGDKFAFVARPQ